MAVAEGLEEDVPDGGTEREVGGEEEVGGIEAEVAAAVEVGSAALAALDSWAAERVTSSPRGRKREVSLMVFECRTSDARNGCGTVGLRERES